MYERLRFVLEVLPILPFLGVEEEVLASRVCKNWSTLYVRVVYNCSRYKVLLLYTIGDLSRSLQHLSFKELLLKQLSYYHISSIQSIYARHRADDEYARTYTRTYTLDRRSSSCCERVDATFRHEHESRIHPPNYRV